MEEESRNRLASLEAFALEISRSSGMSIPFVGDSCSGSFSDGTFPRGLNSTLVG